MGIRVSTLKRYLNRSADLSRPAKGLFATLSYVYFFIARNINVFAFFLFAAGYFFVLSRATSHTFPREASALAAALLAYASGFPIRAFARKVGWLDRPGGRKDHENATPLGGGIVILIGILGGIVAAHVFAPSVVFGPTKTLAFGLGMGLTLFLGLWDDIKELSAVRKLLFQILIGSMMWFLGFRILKFSVPFVGSVNLGIFGLFLTIFWYVALMNALNLIDGLDGLACGIAVIAGTTVLGIASIWGKGPSFLYSAIFVGACLGFLPHNFHPAKIFLGDAGSLLLGFCLATLTLETSTKSHAFLALLIPLMAVFLPVADAGYAFLRRVASKKNPFEGDHRHLHHRLLAIGLSRHRVVFILYYISMIGGVLAYLLSRSSPGAIIVVTILIIGGFFLLVQSLVRIERANGNCKISAEGKSLLDQGNG